MGKANWGADPEFFGPRHAHREGRIVGEVRRRAPAPGLHLECAAGVGSLSLALALEGFVVVAADRSLRSLAHLRRAAPHEARGLVVLPVVADILSLPFSDQTFASATCAETLEHISDDRAAVRELARVIGPGGWLVGTVPAGPDRWSEWDDWAGHLRRYTPASLAQVLREAGGTVHIRRWGWPLLALYDQLFLRRVNRRRLRTVHGVDEDPTLRRVSSLGRRRWLVRAVRALFELDRLFDGAPWGVELLFAARRHEP